MRTLLYVGNLSPDTTPAALERAFACWGGRLGRVRTPGPGTPSTSGFITVEASEAAAAIQAMHGALIAGRRILVYEAADQPATDAAA